MPGAVMCELHGCETPGCHKITTILSHAQTVVSCASCSACCQGAGEKARLTENAPAEGSSTEHTTNPESRCVGNHLNKHILDKKIPLQFNSSKVLKLTILVNTPGQDYFKVTLAGAVK